MMDHDRSRAKRDAPALGAALYLVFTCVTPHHGQHAVARRVVDRGGTVVAQEKSVQLFKRWLQGLVVVGVAALAAGCCVVPPYGWGHGPRGHGYYPETSPPPQYRGGGDHRPGPSGPSRY